MIPAPYDHALVAALDDARQHFAVLYAETTVSSLCERYAGRVSALGDIMDRYIAQHSAAYWPQPDKESETMVEQTHTEQSDSYQRRAIEKARVLLGWEDMGDEAAICVDRDEETGLYEVLVSDGRGTDDLLAEGMTEREAIGVAHALDAVYQCGVYEEGRRL